MNPFSVTGRKIVVTGGSRGIGAAIVKLLARCKAEVIFCHLDDDFVATELTSHLRESGHSVVGMACDVADELSVSEFAQCVKAQLSHVDILINCAGIGGNTPFPDMSVASWDKMIAVHLRGTFLVTRAFYGGMIERRSGRIINIASQLAYKGAPQLAHYCAAKAGILGFTRALSHEAAPFGVLVNAIAPGPVETEMLKALPEAWRQKKQNEIPLGRFGCVDEIAPTVLLLASDAGTFYVGQTSLQMAVMSCYEQMAKHAHPIRYACRTHARSSWAARAVAIPRGYAFRPDNHV